MSGVALALLIGLLAIAFAILRVAQTLDAVRITSIEIANSAVASYAAAHKLAVLPSSSDTTMAPPQAETQYENKSPRFHWPPAEDARGPKGK
jgi:hypothetical protein